MLPAFHFAEGFQEHEAISLFFYGQGGEFGGSLLTHISLGSMRNGVAMAIGAATFAVLQIIWSLGHAYGGWRGAWIMKAAPGFVACFVVFLVVGAVVIAYRHSATDFLGRAGSVTLGASLAMIVALLIIGPGNLWPLVIALDSVVIGGGVLVGGVIGTALGGKHAA